MKAKRRLKENLPERIHPGDREAHWCSPGSIEQELDMCETGSLRGDEILHQHGAKPPIRKEGPVALDLLLDKNWNMDLSEEDREGDEMSGDEHSSGRVGIPD